MFFQVFSNVWQELIMTGVLPFLALLFYNIRIYGKIRESTRHECHRFEETFFRIESLGSSVNDVTTLGGGGQY